MFSSPGISDDIVYFGSDDGYLYAVDIQTGEEKWKFQASEFQVWSSPAIADGVVYIGTSEGHLYAVK